jgi:hypothetical protein
MPTKHAAYALSKAAKAGKTMDRRTRMGKHVALVRENLLSECGDKPSQSQLILIDRVVEKLVFVSLISQFAMDQERIVDDKGNLLPALGRSYLSYSEALRRDLMALKELGVRVQAEDLYEKWRQSFLKGCNEEDPSS